MSLMVVTVCLMLVVAAAAFKAGKIQNNPFSQASVSGGAAIPPPSNIAGQITCIFKSKFLELFASCLAL